MLSMYVSPWKYVYIRIKTCEMNVKYICIPLDTSLRNPEDTMHLISEHKLKELSI